MAVLECRLVTGLMGTREGWSQGVLSTGGQFLVHVTSKYIPSADSSF